MSAECAFCPEPGLYPCGWQEEQFVTCCYRDLIVGDRVRRFHDEHQKAPAIIDSIEDCGSFWKIVLKLPGARRYGYRSINVQGPSFVKVSRVAACGLLSCEFHVREVDQNRHYCRNHWNSWQDAITQPDILQLTEATA